LPQRAVTMLQALRVFCICSEYFAQL